MKDISVIGLDIAKSVFHSCAMDRRGKVLERKRLNRSQVLEYFSTFAPCLVAIESCGGSSYWARELTTRGFEVRLIPAQYVKPFVKSQKNDAVGAEAICEAALRPQMRFVSPNSVAQQDLQNLHRVRERLVKDRTALCNQVRGLLLEYGFVIPKGITHVGSMLSEILDSAPDAERHLWREIFHNLRDELAGITEKLQYYDLLVKRLSRENPVCKRLEQVHGVGSVTSTAIIAAVGNPRDFKNGRQFSAWLGLVPQQHSTGGKPTLGGITKRGDKYLRKLLVHGARGELCSCRRKRNPWLCELQKRRGSNKAAVALANKNARRLWAILACGEDYKSLAA